MKTLDSLPGPRGSWKLIDITVTGNVADAKGNVRTESLELWARDPVEVIRELIGNPRFRGEIHFGPIYTTAGDDDEDERVFGEMHESEWWEDIQVRLRYPCTSVLRVT